MKRPKRSHRLDAGIRGWLVNTAKKNYWRVPSWYDLDDLIQDGYICYSICNRKYGHDLQPSHFMALVKVSYINHIHDLANSKTRNSPELIVPMDSPVFSRAEPEEATFFTLLKQLPNELQELLFILLNDAKSIPMLRNGRERESTNAYLCRLIGVDPEYVNLQAVFKEHFGV